MHLKSLVNLFFALVLVAFWSSCTPQRKLIYLQGDSALLNDTTSFTLRLFPGDILMVQLFTINPDAFPGIGISTAVNEGSDNRSAYEKGFVIDKQGNLSLPYVGTMHLAGLSIDDAHDTIIKRFRNYIDDPVIVIKKLSFKVSVLGEVNRPGLYYVPNEQLTLLEALAMAGDLNNFADRTNLKILRKTSTGSIEIPVDITRKESFTGSTRFIYPDDVIYVPPTRKKAFTAVSPATAVFTSLLTAMALLATAYFRSQ
ncbi:MAG: polysaccharide biosynthesis/export family protein [Bacteroidia bacterium]|nr:polysaccharide biosynthesis/export family protein [Bacteroidia bacterium]